MVNPNSPEITALIEHIQKGSEQAFGELYGRYSGAVNGAIKKFISDDDLAQDVLQETFIKIWKNIAFYDDSRGTIFTWMLQIARNSAIDAIRKMKKDTISEIQIESHAVSSSLTDQQNVQVIGLDKLVADLPEEQRLMIEYLYFKGYTQQEVSDELNLPLGTVKTRSRLAMRELRKWFTILFLITWI